MPKTERNYGLSLLKVIMCFEVLCCHFLSSATTPIWRLPLTLLKTSAVPVFMVISFLLCRKAVVSGDTELLGRRVRRLLWPQISWAVAYYLLCFVLNLLDSGEILSPFALVWQLLTGSNEQLNPAMWFQTDLILLTVIFSLLFAWLKPKLSYGIILLVATICLILQYGGMNYALFEPLQTEIKYSLGRIVEVWPFAAAAVCLFSLACRAFEGDFDGATIKKWLAAFYRRFFTQQFKRSCMPDGVKVGSVCLSPRGDWRMPSEASFRLWMEQVEQL